jgi:uroporphyrinogen-III decarboxylase
MNFVSKEIFDRRGFKSRFVQTRRAITALQDEVAASDEVPVAVIIYAHQMLRELAADLVAVVDSWAEEDKDID